MNYISPDHDAVIIGAGFGGLYALHALREKGFNAISIEAGSDVGGTWFWNRYPGARCDVESLAYQYSFSQDLVDEWTWSERYATQPEILAYANWVADRLQLRSLIRFNTRVESAFYDEVQKVWKVTTSDGRQQTARFVVAAAGSLSAVSVAPFPGADSFAGEVYHPGSWPAAGVDLTGKRVAVVGVGSSAVQLIPEVAKVAAALTVLQRTPAYTIPARNRPLYDDEVVTARRNHGDLAARARHSYAGINLPITGEKILETPEPKRSVMLEKNWKLGGNLFLTAFTDVGSDLEANNLMADFVRAKIKDIVDDPDVARKLTPTDYPIGSKRIITDTNYWATFNRPHVELISVAEEPIEAVTPHAIRTASREVPVDVIIYATGYDSMTGSLTRIDIRGRNGITLKDSWQDGAHTYLGLTTIGFPNLFTVTGPQSPAVLVNMFAAIEQHVEWIVDCVDYMRENGIREIEPTPSSEQWWGGVVDEAVQHTLYLNAKSWYRGSNIDGKANQFLVYTAGLADYRAICDDVASHGYRGFIFNGHADGELNEPAPVGARA